jgi:hypothetical protein
MELHLGGISIAKRNNSRQRAFANDVRQSSHKTDVVVSGNTVVDRKPKLSLDSRSLREEGRRLRRESRNAKQNQSTPRLNLVDGQRQSSNRRSYREKHIDANTLIHYAKVNRRGNHNHDYHSPINRKWSEAEKTSRDFWKIKFPDEPKQPLGYSSVSLADARKLKRYHKQIVETDKSVMEDDYKLKCNPDLMD